MITQEQYLNLITSQHRQKARFVQTVQNSTAPFVSLQATLSSMISKFDIDDAVGDQLDIIGLWVGASRFIDTPLTNIYFSFDDTAEVGWDSGVWQGPFSPTSGLTSLPDDIYRTLIKAKIAANRWNGTIPNAYEIWETVFTNIKIIMQDLQDMTFVVGIVGTPPP